MEARLPDDKLARIKQMTTLWLTKKNATKREILSLIGLLQHATKVVKCGRTFVSRMYATACKVKEMDFYTRLNKDFRSDLCWWHIFVETWNGLSLLRCVSWPLIPDIYIQTDASGSWGCGSFCVGKWLQWKWPNKWLSSTIMAKELVPIVLSCAVWGCELAKHSVCVQCDNFSVVAAIKKGAARETTVMHLLRCLWFFVAHYDILLIPEHIPGVLNMTADYLSRCQMHRFFLLILLASLTPSAIHLAILEVLNPQGVDWTPAHFHELFYITTKES